MKRIVMTVLALMLLTGCGARQAKEIDLAQFFAEISEKYGLVGMVELEGEMLDVCYPGLSDVNTVQRVAYAPMISASVSEYVFLQCADAAAVQEAETILRDRVRSQAEGGAWYPESMAAWSRAQIVTRGNYVLLIASDGQEEQIAADFAALWR